MTGFAAADFSPICNADLERFTLGRLMEMLSSLDSRIRVTAHVDPQQAELDDTASSV